MEVSYPKTMKLINVEDVGAETKELIDVGKVTAFVPF